MLPAFFTQHHLPFLKRRTGGVGSSYSQTQQVLVGVRCSHLTQLPNKHTIITHVNNPIINSIVKSSA